MKIALNEQSLNWALAHLTVFGDNDFFPPAFEFQVFANNWQNIRNHILAIDIASHSPRHPLVRFAPKINGSFRIVHRLDPIDSLIYTALVHEACHAITSGGKDSLPILVEPAGDGSFFRGAYNAWQKYSDKIEKLSTDYLVCGPQNTGGYVLTADIQDFHGRLLPRSIVQILNNAKTMPPERIQALHRFLVSIATGAGRGLPVGPAATTVLGEIEMIAVDRYLAGRTPDFARWADDILIFFKTREDAESALKDLSTHLHIEHEMSLAPRKTAIMKVEEFRERQARRAPQEQAETNDAELKLNQFVGPQIHTAGYIPGWLAVPPNRIRPTGYSAMTALPEHQAAASVYRLHFERAIGGNAPDIQTAKRLMRKAAIYRMDALISPVLANFDRLAPVIRDAAIYLDATLDQSNAVAHEQELRAVWERRAHASTYSNEWLSYVMTHPGFSAIDLPKNYNELTDVRSKALIALRKNDAEWVRRHASQADSFELWDRRGVLYASSILSEKEKSDLANAPRRGISERSIARALGTGSSGGYGGPVASGQNTGGYDKIAGPGSGGGYGDRTAGGANSGGYGDRAVQHDSYSAYGAKPIAQTPRWLSERAPELDAILREHGAAVMVTLQDSVDSGNCISETEKFMEELVQRLGLPADSQSIAASALLADRDDPLTRRAARAAAARYAQATQPSVGS